MTTQYKALVAALMLSFIAPSVYAGRGPDEAQFQQRVQKMDQLIEQAGAAATPAERERLLAEHMQEMHACMGMMKGGWMDMHSGGMGAGMGMDDRMMNAEKRMDMMQMMMDQMMKQHEQSMKMVK